MTEPEWRLWHALRNRQLDGKKIVRQCPIGPYIADFCCRERRLIIEIDGWTHGKDDEIQRDLRRTAWLEENGYRVLRFHNEEVMRNLEGVLETIRLALE